MHFLPAMKQMFWKIDNESLKKGKSPFLEKMLAMNKNYFLKKGKKISEKFRKIPKLMSVDEYEKGQREIIDGGSRQITEQIIDNEHELLEELVGDLSDGNLKRLNKNKV